MQPLFNMNVVQFWLLDALVLMPHSVFTVSRPKLYRAQLARTPHEFDKNTVGDGIVSLIESGSIEFAHSRKDTNCFDDSKEPSAVVAQALNASNKDYREWISNGPVIRLTQKGGAEWEKAALPIWSKFTSYHTPSDYLSLEELECLHEDPGSVFCVGALNVGALESELEINKLTNDISSPLPIKSISPYPATYWKSFDQGFISIYAIDSKAYDPDSPFRNSDALRRLQTLQRSTVFGINF